MTDLAKLIAIAEKATPGKWFNGLGRVIDESSRPIAEISLPVGMTVEQGNANQMFIAALSPSVALSLLRELAAARKVVEAARTGPNREPTQFQATMEDAVDMFDREMWQTNGGNNTLLHPSTTKTEAEGRETES